MKFESWLAAQRGHAITRLHVDEGLYATKYLAREHTYKASPLETATSEPTVKVYRIGGAVRVTVRVGAAEYAFAPKWTSRGLAVQSVTPVQLGSAETAADLRGRALAALRRAAEGAYQRHRDIAFEAAGTEMERTILMRRLAGAVPPGGGGDDVCDMLRQALLATLQGRTDGVEFACAPRDCQCVTCETRFPKGERGPVIEFGDTIVCGPCLRPARAA